MRKTNNIKHAIDENEQALGRKILATKLLITKLIKRKQLLISSGEYELFTETYLLCTADSLTIHKEFTGAMQQGQIHFHKFGQSEIKLEFSDPDTPKSRAFVWWYLTGIQRQAEEHLEELVLQREIHGSEAFRGTPYTPPPPPEVQQAFRSILAGPTS